ncbi:MAG TPA: transcriptional regulator [Planctomycetaceae bacterium]|nr:transcriptional regulator [Planctomycetaceae bacterium]
MKPERSASPDGTGRFAMEGLERVMHEKARLGILSSLVAHADGLLFPELKELCGLTDGNLNRHLRVLQEEHLVQLWKATGDGRPKTLCRMTPQGRARFLEYLRKLEQIVAEAAEAAEAAKSPPSPAPELRSGWTSA